MSLEVSGGFQRTMDTWKKLGGKMVGANNSLRASHLPDSQGFPAQCYI